MQNMEKRIIIICLLSILSSAGNAQILGVKGGLSFANGKYKIYETKMPVNSLIGFTPGIIGELPVSESFYLNTGVLYIKKGTRKDISGYEDKIRIRYLEIPVNIVFKYDFVTWKIFAQAGPYIGVGLSARIKSGDDKVKVEFGTEPNEYNRADFGINIGGGFEIDNVQVGVNYGSGLRNISNSNREVLRNRVLTVSVVYFMEDIGYTLRNLRDFIF
jgi:hypothetical protein